MRIKDREEMQQKKKNIKIVYLDDQEECLVSTRMIIENAGYDAFCTQIKEEAIELIKSNNVDVMLCDYFLGGYDAKSVIEEIRSFNRNIPILIVTGYSGEKPALETMQELKIIDYIDKVDNTYPLPERLTLSLARIDNVIELQKLGKKAITQLIDANKDIRLYINNLIDSYNEEIESCSNEAVKAAYLKIVNSLQNITLALNENASDVLGYTVDFSNAGDI